MAKKLKSNKPAAETVALSINMTTEIASSEDTALSDLMAMLGEVPSEPTDEIVEAAVTDEVADPGLVEPTILAAEPEFASFADAVGAAPVLPLFTPDAEVPIAAPVTDEDLAAAVSAAESVDIMIAAASSEVADGSVTGDESDVEVTTVDAATGETKKVRVPRKHYVNKAERIKDRLGDALPEFTVLTLDDAASALDEDALKAKMDETMTLIAGMSKKKQNRAGFLLEFVSGKKATLNNVMSIALKTLAAEGSITTGKEGNFLSALLAVPYSPAAARAMGGNTVAVLEDLKLIVPDGKGKFVANADSLLLGKVNSMLFAEPTTEA